VIVDINKGDEGVALAFKRREKKGGD